MKSFEIFTLKKTGKRTHNSTWRLTGESVFSKERECPNGRSYVSSCSGRRSPAFPCSSVPVANSSPLPTPQG